MAALYLHQALFQPADAPPPQASSNRHSRHQGRQLSSFSSATLNTTSENSHAPLVDSYADSSAYLDLLSRQPPHPSESSAITELSLHGDPVTDRERRTHWEHAVRRRLHRLKWARRIFRAIICELGATVSIACVITNIEPGGSRMGSIQHSSILSRIHDLSFTRPPSNLTRIGQRGGSVLCISFDFSNPRDVRAPFWMELFSNILLYPTSNFSELFGVDRPSRSRYS